MTQKSTRDCFKQKKKPKWKTTRDCFKQLLINYNIKFLVQFLWKILKVVNKINNFFLFSYKMFLKIVSKPMHLEHTLTYP